MALGRISGPLLKQNLLREGVDIAFETDLLYLDVNNNRVGINNGNPQYDLDVSGTSRTTDLIVNAVADIADINITGNTISTNGSTIRLGTADNVIYQNKLNIDSIDIENNRITTNSSNTNLEIRPDGTGQVDIFSNVNITGNLYATGDIIADGIIEIGDEDTDYIQFNSEINSDIVPAQDSTYSLGTNPNTGGKQFSDIWVDNFFAGTIDTTGLVADGIDITLRQGNIFYVAENGDDTYSGTHQNDPFATVEYALSQATAGDTVHIYPGEYTENFPLEVPQGVTLKGHSIRSVNIGPTPATQDKDAILLNGESTVEDITLKNFYFNSVNNTGYGFKFAPGFTVTSRSPYIRNITVITKGSTTTTEDPRGFDAGDAGKGAYLDGSVATASSREASGLFHSVTFITPGVDAITLTNGVRVEWLNSFTYFANRSIYAVDGTSGLRSAGRTALRVSDLTGTFLVGEDIEYYDTDGVTLIASGTIVAKDSDQKFYISGKVTGFETAEERIGKTIAVNGNAGLDDAIKKFGTSSIAFHSSGDYLSIQPQNDFGFRTGDFTFETWVYPEELSGSRAILDFRAGTITDVGPMLYTVSGAPRVYINGVDVLQTVDTLTLNQWTHIAVARTGTTMKLFVGGVEKDSQTISTDLGSAKPLAIGARYDGVALNWQGNIDDTRVIKSVGVHTGSFTPPIQNLYATPETVLLLRYNGEDSSTVIEDEVVYAQDIRFSGGASATKFTLTDYTDFGAEVRLIGSAAVYGNYGLYGDGPGVIMYAIGQNLAYVGNGKEVTNDPTTVIQNNEVFELNDAKIRYNSVDHRGDFRVGDLFYVNQDEGTVTFTSANFNVDSDEGLTFSDGVNTTVIDGSKIDTGNLRISGNTVESLAGDVNILSASDQINLQNNVNITGNLDVTGNVTIGGNITIGDEVTDSIEFIAGIDSDVVPSQNSTYRLGTPNFVWKNLWANKIEIDDVIITQNYITTSVSDANLELRANGAGYIQIDDFSIDAFTISTTDDTIIEPGSGYLRVEGTGSVKLPTGTTSERPTQESGLIRFNTELARFEGYDGSDWIQLNGVVDLDGDTKVTAELTQGANDNIIRFDVQGSTIVDVNNVRLAAPRITVDDIEIDTNVITTITTNQDLRLEAQGTGSVLLENFAFDQNTITNTVADSITEFRNTGNGYVKIAGSNGFVLPVGTSLNRPDPAFTEIGMLRFNTADGRVEAFDGLAWGSVAGQTGAITTIDAGFLAVETVLYLG